MRKLAELAANPTTNAPESKVRGGIFYPSGIAIPATPFFVSTQPSGEFSVHKPYAVLLNLSIKLITSIKMIGRPDRPGKPATSPHTPTAAGLSTITGSKYKRATQKRQPIRNSSPNAAFVIPWSLVPGAWSPVPGP